MNVIQTGSTRALIMSSVEKGKNSLSGAGVFPPEPAAISQVPREMADVPTYHQCPPQALNRPTQLEGSCPRRSSHHSTTKPIALRIDFPVSYQRKSYPLTCSQNPNPASEARNDDRISNGPHSDPSGPLRSINMRKVCPLRGTSGSDGPPAPAEAAHENELRLHA